MFTGIVEEIGTVTRLQRSSTANVMTIKANEILSDSKIGDSIAVNGICLTVTTKSASTFTVDIMPETFRRTNLGSLAIGDAVNLERALAVGGRVGGHFVTGHIDGVGSVISTKEEQNATILTVKCGEDILAYTIEKGSIAIDGISLTVGGVTDESFWTSLIPHTKHATTLKERKTGDLVNLEADMLGKYVANALQRMNYKNKGLTMNRLRELGF